MRVLFNATLNDQVRMLDGQWQGVRLASDGRVYFFGGSHSAGVSAPFFRYNPGHNGDAGEIELLELDMTRVCGEDSSKTPTQGKVHSDILEHQGWLYFGTHLSDYTPEGCDAYTGGHLLGYEMASGRFRDFGVIHPNFTNYSAIALDPLRHRIFFYATPFGSRGDGPHLHRIDLASGENRDLGLVAPWVRDDGTLPDGTSRRGGGHGQPTQHLFVDPHGDCWFTVRGEHALFVAREQGGPIERHDHALPNDAPQWYCQRELDEHRALVILPDGFYIFDPRGFGTPRGAFELVSKVDTPGFHWAYFTHDDKRIYWNSRTQRSDSQSRHETRIHSLAFANPRDHVDHGPFEDADGRRPWFVGDLATDGQGKLYTCGRWYVLPEEVERIGVNRHGLLVAVFFTVLDVSGDLPA